MKDLKIVEYKGKRILTTAQSAEFLETEVQLIVNNFNRNKGHYEIGEDYFALEGKEKTAFLKNLNQNDVGSKHAKTLYLWTEFGVMLHVKSINTTKAWNAYKIMLRDYFRLVEKEKQSQQELPVYFNKQTQDRCRTNVGLLPEGYWCVENEMVSQALVLQSLQKELHHWCLPSGSGGKKWINHLREIKHPLLDEDSKAELWVPNLPHPIKIMVYPYPLLSYFRHWLRVEYAEYYDTQYSPSRVKGKLQKQ